MIEETLTTLVSELIKQFTLPVYSGLKNLKIEASNKIRVTLGSCFTDYLLRNYDRYSKTKTLLYREMPVKLKDFYVRTDLKINLQIINENKFIDEIEKNKRLIILGGAGCGKSTFCKSLFLELIEKPVGVFPIFIELRHLNNSSEKSLYNFILNSMIKINPSFNKEQLDYALKLGKVLFILDGFDEINNEEREHIEKEILSLSNNYHGIRILISSRYDSRFSSWEEFYQYRVQDLDKNKALTLINKLDYDRQVKHAFMKELDNKLYESHKSFASNPLLLTMMLLTYEQIAEIPNKVHLFYEQAFLTLFNKHDSLKSLYKRKSYTQLPLDDFKRCLEAFCLLSYTDRLYYFEEYQINKYLNNSIKLSGVNTNSESFLNDLLDSVCILQRDGLGLTFTHRSFQEYFSAQFLVNKSMKEKIKIFDKIFSLSWSDNVISLVYDINTELLENEWIIPKLEKVVSDIEGLKHDIFLVLNKMYSSINVSDDEDRNELVLTYGMGDSMKKHGNFGFFVIRLYSEEYKEFRVGIIDNIVEKEFEDELINYIHMDGDIDLDNKERIDPYAIKLIENAGVFDGVMKNIAFFKKIIELRKRKYSLQEQDIMSMILGRT